MPQASTIVLTVAGLDPSHGAGLTRDLLTFNHFGVNSFSVCTALTVQDSTRFERIKWVKSSFVLKQLRFALKRYSVTGVKIGLIKNAGLLLRVCQVIKEFNPDIQIVWDPVLESSTGYVFHKKIKANILENVCSLCTVVTPNRDEIKQLVPGTDYASAAEKLTKWCAVLLKGGHETPQTYRVTDILFTPGKVDVFNHPRVDVSLHGTGCRYSAALAARLSLGDSLAEACDAASNFVYHCILNEAQSIPV